MFCYRKKNDNFLKNSLPIFSGKEGQQMNFQNEGSGFADNKEKDVKKTNPFSENKSLFSEIDSENPELFKGRMPLENEPPAMYYGRINFERNILGKLASKKLFWMSGLVSGLLILLIALTYGSVFLVSFNLYLFDESIYDFLNYLMMFVQYLVFFPIIFLVAKINLKTKTKEFFVKPKVRFSYVLRWTIISMAAVYIVSFVFSFFFTILEALGIYVNNSEGMAPQSLPEFIAYFFIVVICAPIFEEILFRGFIMTGLMKFGSWYAAVVSGILFGVFHLNHQQMFFAAAFGVILGFVDIKAQSVLPSIFAHFCLNGFSFLTSVVYSFITTEDGTILEGEPIALLLNGLLSMIVFAFIFAGILTLIFEFVLNKKQFRLKRNDCGMTSKAVYFANPITIIFIILAFVLIMLNSFIPLG